MLLTPTSFANVQHLYGTLLCVPLTWHSRLPGTSATSGDCLSYKEAIAPDDKPFSLKTSSGDRKYGDRTEVYNNKKVV
ncbi:hypothetical protein [Coleofasciculus sp. FACHB-SPT9]|uniref:hypothetical protein n=1 Tax=Coleofasciculus sp. FACHB-SPT9 TaxID=2692791 RepID=UPI001682CCDF|nr:hypothetical protein [Coleofasciculus sp. FACHB-SPT9]